ncbi:hypothetical protein GQ457_15G027670 [Hibiscus cannabinus]
MDGDISAAIKNQLCRRLEFAEEVPSIEPVDKQISKQDNGPSEIDSYTNYATSIHANLSDEVIPRVGMEFDTEEDVYDFYNKYAKDVGFSIRKSKGHKDLHGHWLNRVYCCSCQGTRLKDKRDDDVKCHRPETRFGCLAVLKVSRINGKFQVTKFIADHTHVLASPSKRMFLRSQRKINLAQVAELEIADRSGLAPKESVGFLARKVGGIENLGFIPEDYSNYLHTRRTKEIKVGDTGGVLEYLQNMQHDDPNFSYAIQVDLDDLITNIFWTDGRMKLDYESFGDVVCFDTTYRKNKEGRPFALFVGVNHHKQSVIFGAALLYDETCNSFMWLFDSFSKAMSGKKPFTILTDQDAAMAKALASQWPETYHRLCVWHMYQNAAKHLSDVFERFSSFTKDFSSCVYDYDEEEDFLSAWDQMLAKYNLENNSWLQKQFELREKWALVYGRQTFCADMSTTQRSESMNNQIKMYIGYNYDLLRFFHHFERLLADRRYEELKADFKNNQSKPSLPYPVEVLKHAADVYTLTVFKDFSKEIWLTWDCEMHIIESIGTITSYKVISSGKNRHHFVTFDSSNSTINCSCKKFEFAGILCSHAWKVLSFQNFKRIPNQYILKRWTKEAKIGVAINSSMSTRSNDPKVDVGSRYKTLLRWYSHLAARASMSEQSFDIAMSDGEKTLSKVETTLKQLSIEESFNMCSENKIPQADETEQIKNNGKKVKGVKCKPRRKGDGLSIRPKNALEKATRKRNRRGEQSKKSVREKDEIIDSDVLNSCVQHISPYIQAQMPQAEAPQRESSEEK